jgi:catechol 2,3-dioxygenase
MTHKILPASLQLGLAELAVADLPRSVDFYERLVGLRETARTPGSIELGGEGGAPVLRLVEKPGAAPKPRGAAGLFHVAILLPEPRDLAAALIRLGQAGVLTGASDHLVSEALYLDDPDGNGVEIYRDRSREEWPTRDGRLVMATEPLDQRGLVATLDGGSADIAAPSGTRLGHVHLQVGDLAAAKAFWIDALGFELTTTYPGALFMSAGGYHHHVAANVWSSRGSGPSSGDTAGLISFEAIVPDQGAVDDVAGRLAATDFRAEWRGGALAATDPWGSTILFRT